jgi:HK97 family phage portal protein
VAFWNRRETRSTLQYPDSELLDAFWGMPTASGKRVTVDRAIGLSAVWAAVTLISEQVGQLPLKVYRDLGDGDKEEARSHRSWRMLHDRPNSQTPAGRFWATVALHILLYGNCFIEKRRDEVGTVDELWLLSPGEVSVKWWPNLMEKTYIHRPANILQQPREMDDDEILHIFGPSLDGITGMSVIEACKTSLGTALARDEFEGGFYARGAVLSQAIEMEGRIKSDEALKRFKTSMQAIFGGSSKAHQVGVFEDGAKLKQVGSPLKDLEFLASQNMTRTDVAVMFHLPPNKLGGSSGEGLHYSTVEMNQTAIAVDAVAPLVKTISDALSQDPSLMPQNIHWAEFTLEGMLRADAKSRAEFYEKLVGMKAMHPEEVRTRENLPPLTAAQKKELNPPPPPQLSLDDEPEGGALMNGNGNGAMPSIDRS